jgi:hypothetical protein
MANDFEGSGRHHSQGIGFIEVIWPNEFCTATCHTSYFGVRSPGIEGSVHVATRHDMIEYHHRNMYAYNKFVVRFGNDKVASQCFDKLASRQ